MSVCPPIAGSFASFTLTVLKDIFFGIKHKGKRVSELISDFVKLEDEVNHFLARWEDINVHIERQSATIEKNEQHPFVGNKVSRIEREFNDINRRYKELCRDPKSRVRSTLGLNAGTEDQTITNAAMNENRRSQEVENGKRTNTNGAGNENQAGIGKQKIWTCNFFKLARLDKDIVELMKEVIEVRKELVREDLTRQVKPKVVEKRQAEELGNIPSHQKRLGDLLKHVQNEECKRIGVYGEPGVGTTNILNNLNNCFDSSSPLYCNQNVDYVIFITVQGGDNELEVNESIQEKIMERLNIIGGKNRSKNAAIISQFLSKKKYLLLLDDFSPLVKLDDVGIHENHKHGKIVMAAKHPHDLKNVHLNQTIDIPCLSLQEAHELFKKIIDDYDKLSTEHKDMVRPILEQLGGYPGIIKMNARLLNDCRELKEWKGVKQESQLDVPRLELLGIAGIVPSYKRAYENLEGNYLKKCLLYAALFPKGHNICKSTLVECWKAENFLNDCHQTLNAARVEGMLIFSRLEKSCLLQSDSTEYVKMPVYFRRWALIIPFPEEGDGALWVRSGGQLEDEDWNNARRVSVMGNSLKSLPKCPKCKDISTLLLQLAPDLTMIQNGFFINMKKLRVLNLRGRGITLLPQSISNLIALRSLYLNGCDRLNQLPTTINQLKELEVLDIRGTSIPHSPAEILKLVSLRCLRISFAIENCNRAAGQKEWKIFNFWRFSSKQKWLIFPPDADKKLSNLEEMTIVLIGEDNGQIYDRIKEEVGNFQTHKNLNYELVHQSSGSYSQEEKRSNVTERSAESHSNAAERPALSLPIAEMLRRNGSEISDDQNTTTQSHSNGHNAFPNINHLGRPSMTSPQKDKGKGVAKPPGQRKMESRKHQRGIEIREPSETNNTNDERDESAPESYDDGLGRSAGEGISTSRGGH